MASLRALCTCLLLSACAANDCREGVCDGDASALFQEGVHVHDADANALLQGRVHLAEVDKDGTNWVGGGHGHPSGPLGPTEDDPEDAGKKPGFAEEEERDEEDETVTSAGVPYDPIPSQRRRSFKPEAVVNCHDAYGTKYGNWCAGIPLKHNGYYCSIGQQTNPGSRRRSPVRRRGWGGHAKDGCQKSCGYCIEKVPSYADKINAKWDEAWKAGGNKIVQASFRVGDRIIMTDSQLPSHCTEEELEAGKCPAAEKTCTYESDAKGNILHLEGVVGNVKIVAVYGNGRYAVDFQDGWVAFEKIDFESSDSTCRAILEKGATEQCESDKFFLDVTGQGDFACVEDCPPGYVTVHHPGKGGVCEVCNGRIDGRRRANKCYDCGKGMFPVAGQDACASMQDTCQESLCGPCEDCVKALAPGVSKCASKATGSCFTPFQSWCPLLMAGLVGCQSKSIGCFYKIACNSACVCDAWKSENCGGKTDKKPCPASFLQALSNQSTPDAEQLLETGSLDESLSGKRAC